MSEANSIDQLSEATDQLGAAFLHWLDTAEVTVGSAATDDQYAQLATATTEWWAAVQSVAKSVGVVFADA